MQGLAREGLHCLDHGRARGRRNAEAPAVGLVADQRVANVGHVHTDLVGTAGFQFHSYVGVRAEALEHPVMADRRLAAVGYRHALAHAAVAADGRIDLATSSYHANHYAFIDAADRTLLQLVDQSGLRL